MYVEMDISSKRDTQALSQVADILSNARKPLVIRSVLTDLAE
jgi:hypothetical protein